MPQKKTKNQLTKKTKKKSEQKNLNQISQISASYSGPIPPPEILNKYNEFLPGAADRIISMAERQSAHRQEIEKIVIKSSTRDSMLGLIFGLTIGLAGLAGSAYCITSGYQVGGSIIGVVDLVSLVGVFVYGAKQQRTKRENKKDG